MPLLQDLESYAERVLGGVEKKLDVIGALIAQEYAEYEPEVAAAVKTFLTMLFQQEAKDAISAGIAAAKTSGASVDSVLAATGAAVVSTIGANAAADASTTLEPVAEKIATSITSTQS